MHEAIETIIRQSVMVKIERDNTKALFHELSDAIGDIYIPAQTSDNAIKFAYSSLFTLANLHALGCTAKKFCRDNDIEVTSGMTSVRDALPQDALNKIQDAEKHLYGLIYYAGVVDYQELKERLKTL